MRDSIERDVNAQLLNAQEKFNSIDLNEKSLIGVNQLLVDLQKLADDKDSADVVFMLDQNVEIYAHKMILKTRCVLCVRAELSR